MIMNVSSIEVNAYLSLHNGATVFQFLSNAITLSSPKIKAVKHLTHFYTSSFQIDRLNTKVASHPLDRLNSYIYMPLLTQLSTGKDQTHFESRKVFNLLPF